MSGGQFNYIQRRLKDIADEIIELLKKSNYETLVSRKFQQASNVVKLAGLMIHRIDWLVSDDDDPETFLELWPSENHCEDCAAFVDHLCCCNSVDTPTIVSAPDDFGCNYFIPKESENDKK